MSGQANIIRQQAERIETLEALVEDLLSGLHASIERVEAKFVDYRTENIQESKLARLIYVDGAAPNNQSDCLAGGIGVAIYGQSGQLVDTFKSRIELEEQTGNRVTNVRCEMLALIKGLELSASNDTVFTDNEMVVKGYNEWLFEWKSKSWRNSSKKPVANKDLWLRIDKLKQCKPDVRVEWVRGHDGIEGNELADTLASEAAV